MVNLIWYHITIWYKKHNLFKIGSYYDLLTTDNLTCKFCTLIDPDCQICTTLLGEPIC